jgi:ribosome-binding protein aMBF1 (putative translation factor)
MLNHSPPNYKISYSLAMILRLSLYPDRNLGERIKKWRLERRLFQRELPEMIWVNEMTIVNWKKGETNPTKKNLEKLKTILGA